MVIENKIDLIDKRFEHQQQLDEIIKKNKLFKGFQCSAKTGENIKMSFYTLFNEIISLSLEGLKKEQETFILKSVDKEKKQKSNCC